MEMEHRTTIGLRHSNSVRSSTSGRSNPASSKSWARSRSVSRSMIHDTFPSVGLGGDDHLIHLVAFRPSQTEH